MRNTAFLDADLLNALEEKHGAVFAQALMDQINSRNIYDADLQCLEVLQMSEIAHRLRNHTRELIQDWKSTGRKNNLPEVYLLYRTAWHDFLYAFDRHMNKKAASTDDAQRIRQKVIQRGKDKATQCRSNEIAFQEAKKAGRLKKKNPPKDKGQKMAAA